MTIAQALAVVLGVLFFPSLGFRISQKDVLQPAELSSDGALPAYERSRKRDAQFLIDATFGPTRTSLNDIGKVSLQDWVGHQMKIKPSLHREYYRKRMNARKLIPQLKNKAADNRDPCTPGSRWVNYVFSRTDMKKKVSVRDGQIFVDGKLRSAIDPSYTGNGLKPPTPNCSDVGNGCKDRRNAWECRNNIWWKSQIPPYCVKGCFDSGFPYDDSDCSVGWPNVGNVEGLVVCNVMNLEEKVGGAVLFGTAEDCSAGRVAMLNPAVWYKDRLTAIDGSTLKFSTVEGKPDALVLRWPTWKPEPEPEPEPEAEPEPAPEPETYAGCSLKRDALMVVAGKFYFLEERLELKHNTILSPSAHVSAAFCPTVAKHPLNEKYCKMQPTCMPLDEVQAQLTLDTATRHNFFQLGQKYVYAVKGLKVTDAPCGKMSRWERCTDCSETAPNPVIAAALLLEKGTLRDIDVACAGVAAGAVVKVGAELYRHVHAHTGNVYDFSNWVTAHPGGPDKIMKWASTGAAELTFPASHPMDRWVSGDNQRYLSYLGKRDGIVQFRDLPANLKPTALLIVKRIGGDDMSAFGYVACGSPGEVANDPTKGHQMGFWQQYWETLDAWYDNAQYNPPDKSIHKASIWVTMGLRAPDQLRQRVAWALSQIWVTASRDGGQNAMTERFVTYYDIFVRHAFGNFRDIMREVTFSPVMAMWLTYYQSMSFDQRSFGPDENYAREIMQLFTIGLWKLNADGTRMKDAQGNDIQTYDNEDIMSFARVFTGFDMQQVRQNVEPAEWGNQIDPLRLVPSWRDVYPKPDLNNDFLGDGYPLCQDLPADSFLRKGASYEFIGYSYGGPDGVLEISASSKLFPQLCGSSGAASPCPFKLFAELAGDVPCSGSECQAVQPKVLKVEKGYYQYMPPTCVHLFFFSGRRMVIDSDRFSWQRTCENPAVALAGVACCAGCTDTPPSITGRACKELKDTNGGDDRLCNETWTSLTTCEKIKEAYGAVFTKTKCNKHGTWVAKQNCALTCAREAARYEGPGYDHGQCNDGEYKEKQGCAYDKELVSYSVAEQRCRALGMSLCRTRLQQRSCGHEASQQNLWVPEDCSVDVEVENSGKVRFHKDRYTKQNKFFVPWDTAFPKANPGVATGAILQGEYTLIDSGLIRCPAGTEITTQEECTTAWRFVKDKHGWVATRGTSVGTWAGVPYGCSAQIGWDRAAHFSTNQATNGTRAASGEFQLVCKKQQGTCPQGCTDVVGKPNCICSSSVKLDAVFTSMPSPEALQQLKIGAFAPLQNTVPFASANNINAFSDSKKFDANTIFAYKDKFYKNARSTVVVADKSTFRNPPVFNLREIPSVRQAYAEVENLLDHLFTHSNTAPFISYKLIQRFTSSNPSPTYVKDVASAFTTGSFGERVYSGKYGDLAATIAAIVLHPEARQPEGREFAGLLREPIIKIVHFLRSLEYTDRLRRDVMLHDLMNEVGQFPYQSPSVFNFYKPQFQPSRFEESYPKLVAPEFEIFTTPNIISFFNGFASMFKFGSVTDSEVGFGVSDVNPEQGNFYFNGTTVESWLGYIPRMDTKRATQSSTDQNGGVAQRAIDLGFKGNFGDLSCTHTRWGSEPQKNPWWQVDLGAQYSITSLVIVNRWDCCGDRLKAIDIFVDGTQCAKAVAIGLRSSEVPCVATGQVVKITATNTILTLCEVAIKGKLATALAETVAAPVPLDELDILLTGGRLAGSKPVVQAAWDGALGPENQMRAAERAILFTPEFQVLGAPMPKAGKRSSPISGQVLPAPRSYKAAILLYLQGGADTFNMLVPLNYNCKLYDEYRTMRTNMALPLTELLEIDTVGQACAKFGIHNRLPILKELYDKGQAAFYSNVGNLVEPTTKEQFNKNQVKKCEGLFSHADQSNGAMTLQCQTLGTAPKGSGGRMADALGASGFATRSFSISGAIPWSKGYRTYIEMVDANSGAKRLTDSDRMEELVVNITSVEHTNVYCEEYNKQLAESVASSKKLAQLFEAAKIATPALDGIRSGLGRQFKQVGKLIATRVERKAERDFFFVQIGGWDMHENLLGAMRDRFTEVNDAIRDFVAEMRAQNAFQDVVLVTMSDFARTLASNGKGSDHAWAGNHFVLGGSIKGGRVYNDFPKSLLENSEQDLGSGRLVPKYPYESVFEPIARWMGVTDQQMATVFPNLANFNRTYINTLF